VAALTQPPCSANRSYAQWGHRSARRRPSRGRGPADQGVLL